MGGDLRAVLFDVDFTLFRPGPELGPEGYRRLGERHGLRLEPERYAQARRDAIALLQRDRGLVHDEEVHTREAPDGLLRAGQRDYPALVLKL